ncbi:hypothetical protein RCO27_07320 [Sphingosinicella sp. LHD-64]|uniref:hypothetical protein n=1 Tax=Sphingosinicella sp. LHD-64 TaxID=3072139 RepID=UPI002810183A|nr:hypothetical protein [Sphingosinicella sp. LHD-64]MDQ8756037.1 hypothetical protein [Sphingosinicella sp. LHD-64]
MVAMVFTPCVSAPARTGVKVLFTAAALAAGALAAATGLGAGAAFLTAGAALFAGTLFFTRTAAAFTGGGAFWVFSTRAGAVAASGATFASTGAASAFSAFAGITAGAASDTISSAGLAAGSAALVSAIANDSVFVAVQQIVRAAADCKHFLCAATLLSQ